MKLPTEEVELASDTPRNDPNESLVKEEQIGKSDEDNHVLVLEKHGDEQPSHPSKGHHYFHLTEDTARAPIRFFFQEVEGQVP